MLYIALIIVKLICRDDVELFAQEKDRWLGIKIRRSTIFRFRVCPLSSRTMSAIPFALPTGSAVQTNVSLHEQRSRTRLYQEKHGVVAFLRITHRCACVWFSFSVAAERFCHAAPWAEECQWLWKGRTRRTSFNGLKAVSLTWIS